MLLPAIIIWAICAFFLKTVSLEETNYYCTDLQSQCDISIERLLGMWYGIELINHMEDERYVHDHTLSCPILHLSAVSESGSTLYNDYNKYDRYGENNRRTYNYGERRMRYPNYPKNYPDSHPSYPEYKLKDCDDQEFGGYKKFDNNEMRRLRIWWDENGVDTEYQLRYYKRRKGFWISSGPKNGSELVPQLANFAGVVQVIKAVGSHLVLTFCHVQPDRKLFTIILYRDISKPNYDYVDIHHIHQQLHDRGLRSSNIKKLCINGSLRTISNPGAMLIFLISVFKLF